MKPNFKVSNNFSDASGDKYKTVHNSHSSTTPKKANKGNEIAATMSPNSLADKKTIIELAEKEKDEKLKESLTAIATGNENNINTLVQTPKLVAKAVSESTDGVNESYTTLALKQTCLFGDIDRNDVDNTNAIIGRFYQGQRRV